MRVPTLPVHCFLLASDTWLCVSSEWGRALTFELLHLRLLVSFSWLRWHLSCLSPVNMPAHMCMYMYLCIHIRVYTHTCMHIYIIIIFIPHKRTGACLLMERGLFAQTCGSWWEVKIQVWLFPPGWHQGKEGRESGHLRWVGFTVFPACFPATPFCQCLCPPIALGYSCRSPLTIGSRLPAVMFYRAWQVHLCRLWQGYVPAREGRGAVWLDGWLSLETLQSWLCAPSHGRGVD